MKFYIIFSIIFATFIHRSNCGIFGTWQNQAAGIKGNTAAGGIGVVTGTAPTCTAAQLTAMNTQIEAALMTYLMTMVVTDADAFANVYITQTLTTLETEAEENALIQVAVVETEVLVPALMTAYTTFAQGLQTTALQTAINAAITNNVDCAVCVPDRARINSVINDYLMGAGEGVLSTALEQALTGAMITTGFAAINTAASFPTINGGAGYTADNFDAIRDAMIALLEMADSRTTIAQSIIAELKTPLNAAVTNGVIGNLIDAAVAMCTTVTVAAATPTAFNTNICAAAAINGVNFLNWQHILNCLFTSWTG